MRVLVWSINYAPEATGIAPCNVALCEFLRTRGHDVAMVTSFAYYPMWVKRDEDRGQLYRTDLINGVPVHRCWHYVPQRVKAWKRIIHEASFVLTSFARMLSLQRPDVIVVVSPPLLLGTAAWLTSVIRGVPFLFHVQDLQPDAALGLGMLKPGAIARILYALESLAYRKAARVSGITGGMLAAFTRKGVSKEKQKYLPNGVALAEPTTFPPRNRFRDRLGIPPDAMLAVYSGNLGVKQGLPLLIEAAALCRNPRVHVVICGDGAEREALARQVVELKLTNIQMLPLQERHHYEEMLVDADLCLITQQPGTGQFFFPSKLLTTLAFGKAVLAVADPDSELALAVREGEFGYCVPTGDPAAAAQALDDAVTVSENLSTMGLRGREYVTQFEREKVLEHFEAELQEITKMQRGSIS